jgi:hypothetical protein
MAHQRTKILKSYYFILELRRPICVKVSRNIFFRIKDVGLKVFTPCLGVLHEIWGTWCMFSPWMVRDGLTHGRWFVMDLHIGDSLLSGCLTSVGCLLGILP